MRFVIDEIDRDYRAWVSSETKEFDSLEEAEAYCRDQTWTGSFYCVDKKLSARLNSL